MYTCQYNYIYILDYKWKGKHCPVFVMLNQDDQRMGKHSNLKRSIYKATRLLCQNCSMCGVYISSSIKRCARDTSFISTGHPFLPAIIDVIFALLSSTTGVLPCVFCHVTNIGFYRKAIWTWPGQLMSNALNGSAQIIGTY